MATLHYHPTNKACNLSAEARHYITEMLALGESTSTTDNGITFTIDSEPDAEGWRRIGIEDAGGPELDSMQTWREILLDTDFAETSRLMKEQL